MTNHDERYHRQEDEEALARRADRVRERIADACRRAGRCPDEVTLVGVTKTFSVPLIQGAYAIGLRHFGENRAQDLAVKSDRMPGRCRGGDIVWHMIGHLQRNKAKEVVRHADCFHALDSLRLAAELDKQAQRAGRVLPCLVQVNISGETAKFGIRPDRAPEIFEALRQYERLRIEGLMAMASFTENPEDVRPQFRRMRALFDTWATRAGGNETMKHLSMGMSNDFEVAIEEGATHVRIGSALFGARTG